MSQRQHQIESESVIVEIRAGEGGDDAKMLVVDMLRAYVKAAERRGIESFLIEERPGIAVAEFTGKAARVTFANEGGGHRWMRVPPTDKRGRVQTSTVTVAVMFQDAELAGFKESDVDFATARGSGPGGQNRNKTESCVIATHRPTGITVRIDARSQHQNKALALRIMKSRIADIQAEQAAKSANANRKEQVGSGMRGDKIRTYREKEDQYVDHRTESKGKVSKWLRGDW